MTSPASVTKGSRFGTLTAIQTFRKRNLLLWQCRCDCGTVLPVCEEDLLGGHALSCGCGAAPAPPAGYGRIPSSITRRKKMGKVERSAVMQEAALRRAARLLEGKPS